MWDFEESAYVARVYYTALVARVGACVVWRVKGDSSCSQRRSLSAIVYSLVPSFVNEVRNC